MKLAGGDGRTILIWKTSAKKLTIYRVRGVSENCDSVRHATLYQVRRLQYPCAINVNGYDNDVSRFCGRLLNDKQSSSRS